MTDTLIHFPVYLGDYLKNTISYTQAERGAYIDICIAYIQSDGKLPTDERLYIMTRCFSEEERTNVSTVVQRAFKQKNGFLVSNDLNSLLDKQKRLRDQRVQAGKTSAKKRAKLQRALQQSESESESELDTDIKKKVTKKKSISNTMHSNMLFDEFWHLYPPNNGRKAAAKKKYEQLTKEEDYERINDGAKRFAAFHRAEGTERKYIPHAVTWLNQRGWEDEYIAERKPSGGSSLADKAREIIARRNAREEQETARPANADVVTDVCYAEEVRR